MDSSHIKLTVNIATSTIIKIIAILVAVFFLYFIRDILVVLFVALVLATAFSPWVDWLQHKKIPRPIGILSVYLVAAFLVTFVLFLIVPPIASQIGELARNFPKYLESINSGFGLVGDGGSGQGKLDMVGKGLESFGRNLDSNPADIFSFARGIFGSIVSFLLVFVITFYMAVEENAVKKIIVSTVPDKHQPYALGLVNRMQKKIGLWLRGQFMLCIAVGLLTLIGLEILQVKYALVLALIAGITEFVPYLGPIIGAIPGVFLAFTQSPALGLVVAIFYYLVQWTENHILVPKIMQKAVGLNPIISIAVLLIGFKLAGILGAMLSIPVATAANVLIGDIFENRFGIFDENS